MRPGKITISILTAAVLMSYGFDFQLPEWGPKKKTLSEETGPKSDSASSAQSRSGSNADGGNRATLPPGKAPSALSEDNEIVRIQNELRDITEQTKWIQSRSEADRVRLQKIVEQARIHKKIIDTLKVPKPVVVSKTAVNTDEVLRQAKVRLIAEDVRRAQEALRAAKTSTNPTLIRPSPIVKTQKSER